MFRHNARLRKRRPSSPPVFGRGGEKPPPLPKWEGRREASCSPPIFGRGSRDAQVEQARAGERAAGQRAGVERGGGAGGGPGPAPKARAGQRAGVERGGGAGGGPGPAPKARAGQRAGVERGGILLASRNAPVSPSPPFSAGRLGASRSPPHEAPAAGSRSGAGQMPESGDESQGIAVKGLLCPLRYPGSDLGRLRMIWRPHAELERCRVGPRRAQSARARGPCPVAR